MKKLVHEEVTRSPNALAFAISALLVSKNWLAMKMLAPIGDIATPFDSTSMKDFKGQFKNISSSNIQTHVHFYNYHMHKKKY